MESIYLIIQVVVFIYSVILHEIAHGWMANRFGDDTAKVSGRLSLNPLVHIDLFGSVIVPLLLLISNSGFLFGWAKPVPVNPYRLRGGQAAYRWVSLAGVATNFGLAIFSAIVLKITTQYFGFTTNHLGVILFIELLKINVVLGVFNLIPFPGFDGFNFLFTFKPVAALILKTPFRDPMFMARYGLFISIILVFALMSVIGQLLNLILGLFITIFGLYL